MTSTQRTGMTQALLIGASAMALIAGACSAGDQASGTSGRPRLDDPRIELDAGDVTLTAALAPFSGCDEILDYLKTEARERVGPYGLDMGGGGWPVETFRLEGDDDMATDGGGSPRGTAPGVGAQANPESDSASTDSGGSPVVGTNVQEIGVDEPDIVKTDGRRIITISRNRLSYVDITGDRPRVTDTIDLPEGSGHELFFDGDRAVVFTNGGDYGPWLPGIAVEDTVRAPDSEPGPVPGRDWYGPSATVFEIDLADTSDLEVTSTLHLQGQYLSARRVGDTIRMALSSPPSNLPWVYPSGPAGEDRAERFNRQLIDETTIDDWTPSYELTSGGRTTSGPLVDCDRLHRPAEFSGFDVASVLSFGLGDNLGVGVGDGVGVVAGGQHIYASTDRFVVATSKWVEPERADPDSSGGGDGFVPWEDSYTTQLHAFSISNDERAAYVASGEVPGSLLNQFSIDEFEGNIRVLSTEGSPWGRRSKSETMLSVLAQRGSNLVTIGEVGGLGKGESLYSARLLDAVGFAVTFRQIDPFYVLDLSDPTNPTVSGELKIPGFSTYLHPIGDGLVLGIGQDATRQGQVTGLKVSVFDVTDPSAPTELDSWVMPHANSAAEYDHRAFQWLPEQRLAIVPVQDWRSGFNGAVLLEVANDGAAITEVGRITHDPAGADNASDCTELDPDDLALDENSELRALAREAHVQYCDGSDVGGQNDRYCEPIPVDRLDRWFGTTDPAAAVAELAKIAGDDDPTGDRIEICWPDGNQSLTITRTLAVGDTVWTMSEQRLQANVLGAGFDVEGDVGI